MSDQLKDRMMDWVSKTSEQIGDFAAREIPPFVHEYLLWKFWETAVDIACCFFIIGLCAAFWIFGIKRVLVWSAKYKDHSIGFSYAPSVIAIVISILTAFFVFPKQEIKDLIQIKFAPKVYLIERAAEIYKGNAEKAK
jgi:hypothetical protein